MAKDFSDRYKKGKWKLMSAIKWLLPIALILFVVFQFVVGISVVRGNSMADTLKNGDLVLYNRLQKDVQRGDIVAVSRPGGEFVVKRVAALGGDTVDITGGQLFINGELEADAFVLGQTLPESETFSYPITVPDGHVFLLGDNRPESSDSRYYGPVSLNQLIGVIQCRFGFFYLNGL